MEDPAHAGGDGDREQNAGDAHAGKNIKRGTRDAPDILAVVPSNRSGDETGHGR